MRILKTVSRKWFLAIFLFLTIVLANNIQPVDGAYGQKKRTGKAGKVGKAHNLRSSKQHNSNPSLVNHDNSVEQANNVVESSGENSLPVDDEPQVPKSEPELPEIESAEDVPNSNANPKQAEEEEEVVADDSFVSEVEDMVEFVANAMSLNSDSIAGNSEEENKQSSENSEESGDVVYLKEQVELLTSRTERLSKELESATSETETLRSQLQDARTEAAAARSGDTSDTETELSTIKEQLHSEQARYAMMLKHLKDGSTELERQLGVCQVKLKDARASQRLAEVQLEKNVTTLTQEKNTLLKRAITAEESLETANNDLEAHVKGYSVSELDAHKLREGFRSCEKEKNELSQKLNEVEDATEKNIKLTKLGILLRTRLSELEEHNDELATKAKTLSDQLQVTNDVCDGFKAIAEGRAPTAEEISREGKLNDALKAEQHRHNLTTTDLLDCLDDKTSLEGARQVALSKVEEVEHELQDCKSDFEKEKGKEESARTQLRLCQEEADDKLQSLTKREQIARQEARNIERKYFQYKEKVDDPAFFDYVVKKTEWLKKPRLEGLDAAYNKTVKLLGPRLTSTEVALIEMQAIVRDSSQRLSKVMGKPEYSPIMTGVLTYGILLIPLVISLVLVVRLRNKISIAKWSMWGTLYNAIFCGFLFGLYKYLGDEPLSELRGRDQNIFEFLQFTMAISYALYCILLLFATFKHVVQHRCSITIRMLAQGATPLVIGANYYALVWKPVMLDSEFQMDGTLWLFYSVAFVLLLLSLMGYDRDEKDTVISKPHKSKSSDNEDDISHLDIESGGAVAKGSGSILHRVARRLSQDGSPPEVVQNSNTKESTTRHSRSKKSVGRDKKSDQMRRKGRKSKSRTSEKVEDVSMEFDIVDPTTGFGSNTNEDPKVD